MRQRGAHRRRGRAHAADAGAGARGRARDAVTEGRVPEARHTCEPHEHRDARHAAGTHARLTETEASERMRRT